MRFKGITPYAKQEEIINGFVDSKHKFGVVIATRGAGKSLLAQNIMLYWLLNNPNTRGGYITPVYAQARNVFDILVSVVKDAIIRSNRSDLTITFVNGSQLRFLSTQNPDSIRGYRFEYLIIDEASFIRETAVNEAILPTLNPDGKKCLVISTPKHKASWLYSWYLKGLEPNDIYVSYKIGLTDSPYADLDFIEEQRKSLPTDVFKAEYEAIFTDSSSDVFRGLDSVCVLNNWDEPNRTTKYYAGCDVGISNDYSVITIIAEEGRVAYVERINNTTLTEITTKFTAILKRWNVVSCYIETNGLGQGLFELMSKQYRGIKPFTTTQDSKTMGIRRLMTDIDELKIELPSKELFPTLYNELSSYTHTISANGKLSFSHPSGGHDDSVDSLWLANLARIELANRGTSSIRIGSIR